MSGTVSAGSYRMLLANRPLRRAFLVSLAGRFGYALLPLCLLFSIAHATRSFALGAGATAVFGVSGLVMPIQARLLDRLGQRRVLPGVGLWFTSFLTLAAVLASTGVASSPAWIGLCLLGGIAAPSLGPSMRAQWREATTERERRSAYSLDAIAEEAVFLLGPLAASGVLVAGPAWWGIAAAAALIPVGVLGLVASPYAPTARPASLPGTQSHWMGPFHRSGFRRLVLVMAAAGFTMSAALTVLAGEAARAGRPAVIGVVETATGIASVLGALWWGRHRPASPWPQQMTTLLALRVLPALICIAYPTMWTIATTLAITGIVVAPTYVVAYAASDHETDPCHHTEASTWVTSLNNIGISLGTATAGWLFANTSLTAIFAISGLLLLLATGVAATTRERPAAGR